MLTCHVLVSEFLTVIEICTVWFYLFNNMPLSSFFGTVTESMRFMNFIISTMVTAHSSTKKFKI